MEILAFVLAVCAAFYAGTRYTWLKESIGNLKEQLKQKVDTKKPTEEKSIFLDPLDIVTQARMEQEEIIRRLNP